MFKKSNYILSSTLWEMLLHFSHFIHIYIISYIIFRYIIFRILSRCNLISQLYSILIQIHTNIIIWICPNEKTIIYFFLDINIGMINLLYVLLFKYGARLCLLIFSYDIAYISSINWSFFQLNIFNNFNLILDSWKIIWKYFSCSLE